MNKYWKFLSENAYRKESNPVRTTFSFSEKMQINSVHPLLEITKEIAPVKIRRNFSVKIFGDYCVKEDIRPTIKRFRNPKFKFHPVKGICYLLGEGVNTLVANKIGFPSHKLLALQQMHLERRTHLVFEKIHGKEKASNLLHENRSNYHECLIVVFNFLYCSLLKNIFHDDCQLGNLFFDKNFENGTFIDFERAMYLNHKIEQGFAFQLAQLERSVLMAVKENMAVESYRDFVIDYLNHKFGGNGKYVDLFLEFWTLRNWNKESEKLKLLAGFVNPNILSCVEKKQYE